MYLDSLKCIDKYTFIDPSFHAYFCVFLMLIV